MALKGGGYRVPLDSQGSLHLNDWVKPSPIPRILGPDILLVQKKLLPCSCKYATIIHIHIHTRLCSFKRNMYTNISFILWSLHSCLIMAAKIFFWIVFLVFVFFFEDLEGSVTETTNLNLWKMRTAKLVFSATNCRGTSPAIGTNMCLECFFSDWMEGWKGMGWMRCAVIKGFYFVGGGKLILWVYCIHLYTFKHKYFPPNPNLGMRE